MYYVMCSGSIIIAFLVREMFPYVENVLKLNKPISYRSTWKLCILNIKRSLRTRIVWRARMKLCIYIYRVYVYIVTKI